MKEDLCYWLQNFMCCIKCVLLVYSHPNGAFVTLPDYNVILSGFNIAGLPIFIAIELPTRTSQFCQVGNILFRKSISAFYIQRDFSHVIAQCHR